MNKEKENIMKKSVFRTLLSMVLILSMAMPSSLLTAIAADNYIVVDDMVTDGALDHYFTYTEATSEDGMTGWVSDTKPSISTVGVTNSVGADVAQTQHWVWNRDYSEAAKHTYTFTFKGTGVEIVGVKNDAQNTFQLDGGATETVTITGAANTPVTLYRKTELEYGTHTVKATLPEGGTGLQVCFAKVYGAQAGDNEQPAVVYDYKEVTVKNPVANTWTEDHETDGPAEWAFDNNEGTHWHSNYKTVTNANPHSNTFGWTTVSTVPAFSEVSSSRVWIGGEFGKSINFGKMEYQGRKVGNSANWYGQYALYLANVTGREVTDADFELALTGTNTGIQKMVLSLETPRMATHFRWVAFTASPANNQFVTASEIDVFEAVEAIPTFGGAIVDTDTQWTQNRFGEVRNLTTVFAELTAWKNDKATSEIALFAANADYNNVTVTASDLSDGNGNEISADYVTTTFIRSTKAYNGGYLGYGSTTRPVPEDNGSNRSESSDILWSTEPMDMTANTVQPVWVEFEIPEDAAAGIYTGTITVSAEDTEDLVFTYTVEVQDAVLPDATEFADGFDIELWQYPYSSAEYYGVEPFSAKHLEIMESSMEIYKEIGGHAITTSIVEEAWSGQTYSENAVHYPSMIKWTSNDGGKTFDWDYTDFDAWVTFCKGMGLGDKIVLYSIAPWNNSIGYWQNGTLTYQSFNLSNSSDQAIWKAFIRDLIDHLMDKGWFDEAYMGIDERGFSKAAFDLIDSVRNIHDIPLKTAGAMDGFMNKWDLALRVTDLNVGDTAAAEHPTEFAQLLAEREAKGYRTTLYSCTEHQPGNFSLSAPVESYWAILNAGMMGTAGFLRWAYDAWVVDPLRDTTHNSFEPGDCFLIFPDEKTAENPTSRYSVRLARMAEGVRDVNKLMTIAKEVPVLSDEVDAVYENIQHQLVTSRSYLSEAGIATLQNEVAGFKADLKSLTEEYICLKENGTNEVESISIAQGETAEVQIGKTLQLEAVLTPDTLLNNNVTWDSSNKNVATVTADGTVTALQEGTATITVTAEADTEKTAQIVITVKGVEIDESKQVSYYSFDNITGTTVKDEWGSRDGKLIGSTAKGKQGNALSVAKALEGVTVDAGTNNLSGDWTVGYWVKTTSDFTDEISVLEDANQKYSFSLKMAADRDSGFRVGNGSGDVLTNAYQFAKDTWYHITWTKDETAGISMYVNGVKNGNTNNWTSGKGIKAPVDLIGGTGFTGLIDEVKIYNAVLTQEEIVASMQINGINVNSVNVAMNVGETYQISASVVSDKEDKTITYTSANPEIASVSESGLITANKKGSTEIVLANEAGGYETVVTVNVTKELEIQFTIPQYELAEEYQSDIDKDQGGPRQYLGQPDMVRLKDGTLLTSYPVGHGKGPLVLKSSTDDGETWVEHTNTPESWKGSQETPTMYVLNLEDGTERVMLITACPGWGTDSYGNQYGWNTSYSDDGGKTWTEYKHWYSKIGATDDNDAIVAMASLIQLKDENGNDIQKWMGVFHNYGYQNYKTYLTFDENGNEQWTEPELYLEEYRSIESAYQICEVGMFRSPDGERIVAMARSQSHAHKSVMFYSDDEGETWSKPEEMQGALQGERHKAMYDPISGRLMVTFREIILDYDQDGKIENGDWKAGEWILWVGTYEDVMEQNEGDYRIILDKDYANNAKSGDTGYAGFVVTEDGTLIMDSYGHFDEQFSLSWGGGVTTDLCWIRQVKFKLGEVENDQGLIDYTALNAKIAEVENTSEEGYTEESYEAFATVLADAQAMTADDYAQQIQVDAMLKALTDAFECLTKKSEEPKKEVCEVFTDVNHGAWYEGSVQYVYDEEIIIGDGNIFAPDNGATRAMVTMILYRLAGSPDVTAADYEEYNKFGDLPKEKAWYSDAVAWALKEKVATGDDYAMLYNPESPVTREQLAVFLWRYAQYNEEDVTVEKTEEELFGDTYVNSWAKAGFAWAVDREIIRGDEETDSEGNLCCVLNPQDGATRAQLAKMLHRYIGGAAD